MDIPRNLENSLRNGTVVPFVGAGVSMAVLAQSGEPLFPSWKSLLTAAAKRLEIEKKPDDATLVGSLVNKGRLLDAAKEAREALGANWHDFLKSQLDKTSDEVQDASLELARLVWQLGSDLVVTTNYDNVLHWACPRERDVAKWNIEAAAEQCGLLRGGVNRPTIWHLHGHIDDSAQIILTPDGYQRLYADDRTEQHYKAALQTLHHQIASRSFLFIGFSLADEDFTNQLRMVEDVYQGAAGPHYVLLPDTQRGHFHSPTPAVEPVFFRDFGEPLLDCLRQMASIAGNTAGSTSAISSAVADFSPDKPVFYVPFRPKGEQMVGRRDALEQVRRQLCSGKRTSIGQTASFQGLGGLGKTQLAVEYAYEYRNEYPNGVIWINADQDIIAQLIKLTEEARWVSPLSEQPFKVETAIRRLRETSDCLIVFDNLETLDFIAEVLPKPSACPHILVTSRYEQPGFPPVPLDTLTPEQGLHLLLQEADRQPENEDEELVAQAIVNHLDGLPLALELAGAYLRRRRAVGWRQYLELLQDNLKSAFPASLQRESLTRHEADIHSTLKINETIFQEEPLLIDVLDVLTWSGPAPMSLSLLCAMVGADKPSALTGALSLGLALRILQQPEGGERYAIHRLVREVRREDIHLPQRRSWAENSVRCLANWFEARRQDFRDLSVFEADLDHLQAWRHNVERLGLSLQAARLAWLQAYPSYHWGRDADAKRGVQNALDLYEQVTQPDRSLQAHLLNDLGAITSRLGDYKTALKLAERALALRRELFGEEHQDSARSLANVAGAYLYLNKPYEALKLGQQALAIQRKLLGEYHPETARSLVSVAESYSCLRKFSEAIAFGQQALAIRHKLFGEEYPEVAECLNNIASYYNKLGNYGEALKHSQRAYVIRYKLLGEGHPDSALSLNDLSCHYAKLGNYSEALKLSKRALAIRQKLLGDTHPNTVLTLYNVISNLANSGYKPEAIKRLNEQLALLKPDHRYFRLFQQLRADLCPGFRKPSGNPSKRKRKKHR